MFLAPFGPILDCLDTPQVPKTFGGAKHTQRCAPRTKDDAKDQQVTGKDTSGGLKREKGVPKCPKTMPFQLGPGTKSWSDEGSNTARG